MVAVVGSGRMVSVAVIARRMIRRGVAGLSVGVGVYRAVTGLSGVRSSIGVGVRGAAVRGVLCAAAVIVAVRGSLTVGVRRTGPPGTLVAGRPIAVRSTAAIVVRVCIGQGCLRPQRCADESRENQSDLFHGMRSFLTLGCHCLGAGVFIPDLEPGGRCGCG